jgi:hypothetical protein
MPAWLFVVGGILVLVGALLAVDWVTAGHTKRKLVRAKDQSSTDANVGYAAIQRQGQSMENQGNTFI